jgi:hypothetical protein
MQVVKEIIPKTNMLVTNLERVSSKWIKWFDKIIA